MTTKKTKELLLDQLSQTPIIEVACKKAGVGRTTYYSLRKSDPKFAEAADDALNEGISLMNDLCESQILNGAKSGNLTAVMFWLKNRHMVYKPKQFQSSFSVSQDENDNLLVETFGEFKLETKRLVEPYLQAIEKYSYEKIKSKKSKN